MTTPEISELDLMEVDEVDLVGSPANGYSTILAKSAEEEILQQVEKSLGALFGPDSIVRIDTAEDRAAWLTKARNTSDATLKAAYLRLAEGDA